MMTEMKIIIMINTIHNTVIIIWTSFNTHKNRGKCQYKIKKMTSRHTQK